ncbi:hypothetical protein ZHAS_00007639 [Anopheles sinensis]|uniref:Uncharacterized protein n=1 Tax=Anopheles sinensis TaxID=74873 RepID=A0A084VQ36_ANOSI|nr:hypothetical protein ZHAS_00007639 [Anopheles sinensis]
MKNRSKHMDSAACDDNSPYDSDGSNGSNASSDNSDTGSRSNTANSQSESARPAEVPVPPAHADGVVLALGGLGRSSYLKTLDLSINAGALATSNVLLTLGIESWFKA